MNPTDALAFLEAKRNAGKKEEDGLLQLYNMKFGVNADFSDDGFQGKNIS